MIGDDGHVQDELQARESACFAFRVSLARAPVPLPCEGARIPGEINCLIYKQGPRCVAGTLFPVGKGED